MQAKEGGEGEQYRGKAGDFEVGVGHFLYLKVVRLRFALHNVSYSPVRDWLMLRIASKMLASPVGFLSY